MSDFDTSRKVLAFSRNNEELIKKAKNVGCFYCLKVLPAKNVKSYREFNKAANCPECGIDALIPDNCGIDLTDEFLKAMRNKWFNF